MTLKDGDKAMGGPLAATMKIVAPQAQGITYQNVGHWLMEENPEQTIKDLHNFLQEPNRVSSL